MFDMNGLIIFFILYKVILLYNCGFRCDKDINGARNIMIKTLER